MRGIRILSCSQRSDLVWWQSGCRRLTGERQPRNVASGQPVVFQVLMLYIFYLSATILLIAAAIPLRSDVIDRTPVVIKKTDPEYTEEARSAKVEGAVVLQVEIATDGRARNIHVVKSLGYGLDEKAIECVRQWRFRPAVKHGTRVRVPATIEVNFHLKNSRPKRLSKQ